jgi:hypothetical protein
MDIIGWIISAIGGLPGLGWLLDFWKGRSPVVYPTDEVTDELGQLVYFKLMLRNEGRKTARDVMVWIWKPVEAGHSITHNESHVDVVEEDSVWKGFLFRVPGEGQEKLWRLRMQMIHPGQEVNIAEIHLHPDWSGWRDTRWTHTLWRVFSADSAESSGKIMIPVGRSGANLWSMKA